MLYAYTDGASDGREAGIGVALWKGGNIIEEISKNVGRRTNNEAEYLAVIEALKRARALKEKEVVIRADSQLVVRQLKGEYKVKEARLKKLYLEALSLCAGAEVRFEWISRERNRRADMLAKEALDVGKEQGNS
ncbi:MAG: ribonuclease HI family protein [Candidatus Anstonellales archaeon]